MTVPVILTAWADVVSPWEPGIVRVFPDGMRCPHLPQEPEPLGPCAFTRGAFTCRPCFDELGEIECERVKGNYAFENTSGT